MFLALASYYKQHIKAFYPLIFIVLATSIYMTSRAISGFVRPIFHSAEVKIMPQHDTAEFATRHKTTQANTNKIATGTNIKSNVKSNVVKSNVVIQKPAIAKTGKHTRKVSTSRHKKTKKVAVAKPLRLVPPAPAAARSTIAPVSPDANRIGQTRSFNLYDFNTGNRIRTLTARLVAAGRHTDIWVDRGQSIPDASISNLLARFDGSIYPKDISYFANQTAANRASHINILITNIGDMDGYFDPNDMIGQNHTTMIYLSVNVARNEPAEAYNTLAHEFEHLIYFASGGADIAWLDEGLAVYAEYLNGGFPSLYVNDYKSNPSVNLSPFSYANNYYGGAFLFVAFACNQVGQSHNSVPAFLQTLIHNSNGGMTGINGALCQYISNPQYRSFNGIFQPPQLINFANSMAPAAA